MYSCYYKDLMVFIIVFPPSFLLSSDLCSWLHHSDATVGHVGAVDPPEGGAEEESTNELFVHAILSEATLGKFVAKFGHSVTLTETQE